MVKHTSPIKKNRKVIDSLNSLLHFSAPSSRDNVYNFVDNYNDFLKKIITRVTLGHYSSKIINARRHYIIMIAVIESVVISLFTSGCIKKKREKESAANIHCRKYE